MKSFELELQKPIKYKASEHLKKEKQKFIFSSGESVLMMPQEILLSIKHHIHHAGLFTDLRKKLKFVFNQCFPIGKSTVNYGNETCIM